MSLESEMLGREKDKEDVNVFVVMDEVCCLANTYRIEPKRVLGIYNRVVQKNYNDSNEERILLVEKYIKKFYKPWRKI